MVLVFMVVKKQRNEQLRADSERGPFWIAQLTQIAEHLVCTKASIPGGVMMGTYIILSRISPEAFKDPKEFKQIAARVSEKIKHDCPEVAWKDSYVTMGRFDVVDIVEAKDAISVEKAALIST